MKFFLLSSLICLFSGHLTWAGECAELVAPVISGRTIGAKIRGLALANGDDFETKLSTNVAKRIIEATGTEIQTASPHVFMDDITRESAMKNLSLLPEVSPEITQEQVKAFKQILDNNNLYYASFMEVTADEFKSLTQEGRRRLVAGTRNRRWLQVEDLDPYDFKDIQLPKELKSFGMKSQKISGIKLVLLSEIRNKDGLIGYQATYQTTAKDKDARFDVYFTPDRKPLDQEVDLRFR